MDKSGNIALLLVCIGEALLLIFFQYLIEVVILGKENFSLFSAVLFAIVITSVTGYYAFQRRKKRNR